MDRPDQHEILDAVQRFLDEEVVPHTDGRRQFLVRVSANLLRALDRELTSEEAMLAREWQGLDELLGEEPLPAGGRDAVRALLPGRNERLCGRIRDGAVDLGADRAAVVAHVRRTIHDKLTVTNPGYLRASA